METIKPIIRIGNSYGVIIPAGMLKEMGLKGKNKVHLVSGRGFIQIEPTGKREDKIMKAAAEYVKKYRHDFQKLAR